MSPALLLLLAALPASPLPALHQAAQQQDPSELRRLIEGGAEVNAPGPHEWTALHFACAAGQGEAARLLLERGADPNARAELDLTPLHWVALGGKARLVPMLVGRGAKLEARSLYGMTPLMLSSNEEVASALLDAGANLQARDDQGLTPLHLARSKEVGKRMLDRGADLSARARDGRSLLEMVVVNSLLPDGLLFYARRGAGRLKGESAQLELSVLNVTPGELTQVAFSAQSEAASVQVEPALLPLLAPGQMATVGLKLQRRSGLEEGEYPLMLGVRVGEAGGGRFELLSIDTTRFATPEDQGMIRLGKVALKPESPKIHYLLFAAVPLLVILGWAWRWRR